MSYKRYMILLEFYNEWNFEFLNLSESTRSKFYDILYGRMILNRDTQCYEPEVGAQSNV